MTKEIKNYFGEFFTAFLKGDFWCKLSVIIFGAGYFKRKQWIKGLLITALEAACIYTVVYLWPFLSKISTLGTVQREEVFDPLTLTKTVNDYDNSLLILLYSIVAIIVIVALILLMISNMKAVYRLQVWRENGKHVNTFRESFKTLFNEKFHVTLLTLPSIGVLLMNIIPIIFMSCVAFTNYDKYHQPPTYLFTWVGIKNFITMFTTSKTISFGYVFVRILAWTLVWAVIATFTTFIGGILLAMVINHEHTMGKKMWRTLFVITIAIPQFVTLLLVSKMFGDYGIINTVCQNIGLTGWLKSIGLVGANLDYIPFLSAPGWAHVMIILINIWVGVPYQMLSATGILLNLPVEQLESARIDGASKWQIFIHITMPYIMFICGPSLIQSVIANINNFNVIYLLTSTAFTTTNMAFANSSAKETDLLITWLFTLTNDYSNYKMASVIGIITFVICALLTLLSYSRMIAGNREEVYR